MAGGGQGWLWSAVARGDGEAPFSAEELCCNGRVLLDPKGFDEGVAVAAHRGGAVPGAAEKPGGQERQADSSR